MAVTPTHTGKRKVKRKSLWTPDFATCTYPISLTETLKLSCFPFRAPQWGFSVCGKETTCLSASQNSPVQFNHQHYNQHSLQDTIPNICVLLVIMLLFGGVGGGSQKKRAGVSVTKKNAVSTSSSSSSSFDAN